MWMRVDNVTEIINVIEVTNVTKGRLYDWVHNYDYSQYDWGWVMCLGVENIIEALIVTVLNMIGGQ